MSKSDELTREAYIIKTTEIAEQAVEALRDQDYEEAFRLLGSAARRTGTLAGKPNAYQIAKARKAREAAAEKAASEAGSE